MKRLVIYHGNCIDGFTAAWAAWKKFGEKDTSYHPAHYQEAPPDISGCDEVFIVDFSYPKKIIGEMRQKTQLFVFDHHKTAAEDLYEFAREDDRVIFDMGRSGAGITWDVLHRETQRPWLVDFVEDRDLWRWRIEGSPQVNAFISTWEHTFEKWNELSEHSLYEARTIGSHIVKGVERYVNEMAKAMTRFVKFDGHNGVPVINAPYINISELVGKLAEDFPSPFAMGWSMNRDAMILVSLRSRGDFDVSALAKKFGGGGHARAAGFKMYPAEWFRLLGWG